ncbi:MAG: hypothetical protein M3273_05355 [Actinomycetota bacterium]|nr:hypothetical protein [Actinomycetota bacterium]
MTVLVGGAALLAAGAGVALILGWSTSDGTMVWASIIASLLAACLLVVAARRTSEEKDAVAREQEALARVVATPSPPHVEPEPAPEATDVRVARTEGHGEREELPEEREQTAVGADEDVLPTPAAPRKARAKDAVVAIPDRKRFHRPECRYASAAGAEPISKATARRRGYTACGICKP